MPGFNIPFNVECHDDDAFNPPGASNGPDFLIETARKHRYVLDVLEPLGDRNSGILLYMEKCTRPAPEFDEITIHNGQDEIYRPGKNRWGPVEFTFYEKLRNRRDAGPIQPDGSDFVDQPAELLYQWWANSTANLAQSRLSLPTVYLKNAELQMLDGSGSSIWTYFLYDCWPQKVTPSDLSYSDSDIATISVTLRFNKAQEKRKR